MIGKLLFLALLSVAMGLRLHSRNTWGFGDNGGFESEFTSKCSEDNNSKGKPHYWSYSTLPQSCQGPFGYHFCYDLYNNKKYYCTGF